MRIFVGISSYNRARILELCLRSFLNSKLVKGFIVVADSISINEMENYVMIIKYIANSGFEVIHDIIVGRRGSTKARNKVFEKAGETLSNNDVLLLYDDDYIYPGDQTLIPALYRLKDSSVGIVSGRIINLSKRRIDPDFALNIVCMANALTRLTGFIMLDIKHGPREVEYTTPLMVMRTEMLNMGVKYDEGYGGTGYREESDLQRQVRVLGYKIIFEPDFYAYHLAVESGGNRYSSLEDRMYWKWKNHTFFMNKWQFPVYKKVLSYVVLTVYTALNGLPAIRGMVRAVKPTR
jgi:GT2 family glycosyltransferase